MVLIWCINVSFNDYMLQGKEVSSNAGAKKSGRGLMLVSNRWFVSCWFGLELFDLALFYFSSAVVVLFICFVCLCWWVHHIPSLTHVYHLEGRGTECVIPINSTLYCYSDGCRSKEWRIARHQWVVVWQDLMGLRYTKHCIISRMVEWGRILLRIIVWWSDVRCFEWLWCVVWCLCEDNVLYVVCALMCCCTLCVWYPVVCVLFMLFV